MQADTSVSCDNLPVNTLRVEQAQARILANIKPLSAIETLPIAQALGRILAYPLQAQINVPSFINSAMDGYALRHADMQLSSQPTRLKVIGSAFAGRPFQGELNTGECVRIMTGAVLPQGADSVVMQEQVQVVNFNTDSATEIEISGQVQHGEHLRHPGDDMRQGQALLAQGWRLNAADIGLLASQGMAQVAVLRLPRVAFFSTGDELKPVGETLRVGDIYDSNRYTLQALLAKLGVESLDLGVIPDQPEAIKQAFTQAMQQADMLISSGGASVGEADYIRGILQQVGELNFWRIAMKPGKPLVFGQLGHCRFFGLPGNPVSLMATFLLFVRPAILKLRGETVTALPEYPAFCETPLKKAVGRKDYQRGWCWQDTQGQWRVRSTGDQGSHILSSMSAANCFIALPLETGNLEAGATVSIIPFEPLL